MRQHAASHASRPMRSVGFVSLNFHRSPPHNPCGIRFQMFSYFSKGEEAFTLLLPSIPSLKPPPSCSSYLTHQTFSQKCETEHMGPNIRSELQRHPPRVPSPSLNLRLDSDQSLGAAISAISKNPRICNFEPDHRPWSLSPTDGRNQLAFDVLREEYHLGNINWCTTVSPRNT